MDIQKGNLVCLQDNEYLPLEFQELGHYGWFYVYEVMKTKILIKHDRKMSGQWIDKRAVYDVKEK